MARTTSKELKATLALATPLCGTQLGHNLMGIVDSAMLGRVSEAALAGSGIGNLVLFVVTIVGVGVVMGLDTLIPQAIGAGEPGNARRLFRSGVRLAVVVSGLLLCVAALTPFSLRLFQVDPAVAVEAKTYMWGRLGAIPPTLIIMAQRAYLQGFSYTRPLVIGMIVGNVVNVIANYLLVFGDAGLEALQLPPIGVPAMGVLGAALSTTVVSWTAVAIAGLAIGRRTVVAPETRRTATADWKAIVRIGAPIGLQLTAEVGAFGVVALLAGSLGELPSAAHQIAQVLTTLSLSVALGVGAATSVRVGRAVGARNTADAQHAGTAGLMLGVVLMGGFGLIFAIFPGALATGFTPDQAVVAAATPLIRLAALFQLADAIQVVAAGALRGAGDTKFPFAANLIGHYLVGLPLAVILALGLDWGMVGLWTGLASGLTFVAVLLLRRLLRVLSAGANRAAS